MTFPERLRQARRARGLTQAQLAERVGVHVVTVARWEAGAQPSAETLKKIADALEVDFAWLSVGIGEQTFDSAVGQS